MKNLKISAVMAFIVMGGVACSTSNTDTASTASTTESVVGADSVAAAATDQATGATTTQTLDSTSFPVMAASSDMFEMLSSTEAQAKAVNPEVKSFAQHMLTDHTKTSTELKSIAAGKNILLPAAPLPMHQRQVQALANENAKNFDKAYMTAQVAAHQQAVNLFQEAATSAADPEFKAFAAKNLPALKMHLDMAKATRDKLK